MADQKPPKFSSGEVETLRRLLQYQRESIVRKIDALSDEQARWSPVGSATSLMWLLKHLTIAERRWFLLSFAGHIDELGSDLLDANDRVATVVATYRATWSQVDDVVDAASGPEEACRAAGEESALTLRWVLAHVLEETARHAGHADIIREMIDGSIGR